MRRQEQKQQQQHRQQQRLKSRQGGILDKTADHLERKRQLRKEAAQPAGTFKPDISEYSRQLKREEPVHQRLFRVGKQNLEKKRERIIHDSKYDWESGKRLFQPKTNATSRVTSRLTSRAASRATSSSPGSSSRSRTGQGGAATTRGSEGAGGGVSNSIVAGNRLYRNALHSRAKLREKQIAELVLLEQQRQKVRMSPQSRQFAQKKIERELQTVFQRLNVSGTGLLTFEELSEGMASVHIQMPTVQDSESSNTSSLSMPDVLFWDELTLMSSGGSGSGSSGGSGSSSTTENGSNVNGGDGSDVLIDLVTFLSTTYKYLKQADPTWTQLQVTKRSLRSGEVIVTWCRAWMEALAVGGRTPYGHVQPGGGHRRWKQSSNSALGTDYNDFSGASYRERKFKHAYESPDERECTFKPKLTKRSRELDRRRVGNVGGNGIGGNDRSSGGGGGPSHETRVALMLMLHQRKEDKLNVEREKQALKDMEECTFSPVIKHSTRTLRMVRKSMDDSDRSRFSADSNRNVPAFARLHDQHEEYRKKKYMELTSEQRELLDYCTFQPNLQLRQQELQQQEESGSSSASTTFANGSADDIDDSLRSVGDTKLDEEKEDEEEADLLANFDLPDIGRMPWENAAVSDSSRNKTNTSASEQSEAIKKSTLTGGVTVKAIKPRKAQNHPFFAAGVHDHTARIRSARKKKREKERELQLMGKSTEFANSLRMSSPPSPPSPEMDAVESQQAQSIAAASSGITPSKQLTETLLVTPSQKLSLLSSSTNNSSQAMNASRTPTSSPTRGRVSLPPALRMRVQAADGGSQTIEIYAGDAPAVVASNFARTYSLDAAKSLKLQQLIAAHMAKNDIPMTDA